MSKKRDSISLEEWLEISEGLHGIVGIDEIFYDRSFSSGLRKTDVDFGVSLDCTILRNNGIKYKVERHPSEVIIHLLFAS